MDTSAPRPTATPRALAEAEARRVREAEALRENLRKRKLQARAREVPPEAATGKPSCP